MEPKDFNSKYRSEGPQLYKGWQVIAAFSSSEEAKICAEAMNKYRAISEVMGAK